MPSERSRGASSSVAQVVVNPLDDGAVRVHGLPGGPADFRGLEAAVRHVEQVMLGYLAGLAREAGVEDVELSPDGDGPVGAGQGRNGPGGLPGKHVDFHGRRPAQPGPTGPELRKHANSSSMASC